MSFSFDKVRVDPKTFRIFAIEKKSRWKRWREMNHTAIDQRSLVFGQMIAEKLRQDPSLIQTAKYNIDRWLMTSSAGVVPALLEWKSLLHSVDEVLVALTSPNENAVRLRQSNPFAGVLSSSERDTVIRHFQSHDTPTA